MQTDGFQTKLDKTGVFSTGEQTMYESKLSASILWITWLLKSLLLLTYVLSRHWWSYLNKPGTFQSAIIIEHSYLFRLPFFEINYVPTFYKRTVTWVPKPKHKLKDHIECMTSYWKSQDSKLWKNIWLCGSAFKSEPLGGHEYKLLV